VMEKASGQDLDPFFDGWLYQPGHPRITCFWSWSKKTRTLSVRLDGEGFDPPQGTEIGIRVWHSETTHSGKSIDISRYNVVKGKGKKLWVYCERKPSRIELDPFTLLLFEGEIVENPDF
jgi:hypothetical protein